MGKKKKRDKQTSKGERRSVSKQITKSIRKDFIESGQKIVHQAEAFRKGKKVMLTIPNPNKHETKRRFIRVPATEVWKRSFVKPLTM